MSKGTETDESLNRMRLDCDRIFRAGLAAVEPEKSVFRHCQRHGDILEIDGTAFDLSRFNRVLLLGAGKAGAPMAGALEKILGGRLSRGLVLVKYGHVQLLEKTELVQAGHPVPDGNGLEGTKRLMELAEKADQGTLVICVLSGGGSALMPWPAPGIDLADKQETTRLLLECGASIHEINTVRKHLSRVKGGRLASAVYPGTLACLVLSDVIGNDLDIIASGPGVPDPGTFEQCMEIVHGYGLESRLPVSVQKHLKKGAEKRVRETPKPGDPVFDNTFHAVIACGMDALKAAAAKAEALGYHPYILSDDVSGETVDAAGEHVRIALSIKAGAHGVSPPACLLSGGETTVTLQNPGKGGRNQEFALKCALDIAGLDNIAVLSAGTDGTDGPTDAAGGLVDTSSKRRAEKSGFDARHHLDGHDAYPLLEAAGDLYKTGPTFTNVMDMRVILVK
ncbi:MAG: glycerate kinase [Desulfobacteraceae bacterium]